MGKRVRISNDSLNSYGTRVLTSGMDTEQYARNPVLLYMHERGQVIGFVKDLVVDLEKAEVTGELVFDEATELSKRCKAQWEFGSLKMVSAGLDVIELSEDPMLLLPGQTSPTISKSRLFEVSLVDIGANDDAIVLQRDGKRITLGKDSECPLPKININNKNTEKEMDIKKIALQLGLPETVTEDEITAKIGEFKAAKEQNDSLLKEKESLLLAQITSIVENAIKEKKFGEDKKDHFINLGKKIGLEELKSTVDAMSPHVKLSAIVNTAVAPDGHPYTKLSDVPSDKLIALRKENVEEYKRLYKAEYGMECDFE